MADNKVNMVKVAYAREEITTIEQLKESIAKALDSANTMKKKVQIACINVLIMAGKAKTDEEKVELVIIANDMVNALGDGIRAKGLIGFFLEFGFTQDWNKQADGFNGLKSEQHIRENFERAKVEHWYTKAPEAPFKDYNMTAAFKSFLKTAKAKADDKEHEGQITIDTDLLELFIALDENKPIKAEGALKLVERLAA